MYKNPLDDRNISGFPLSIGTALALESIFAPRLDVYDPDRKIPEMIDLKKYSQIYINIFTLYRNIVSSLKDRRSFETVSVEDIIYTLKFEMDSIKDIFNTEGNGICKPIFYVCDYKSAQKYCNSHKVEFRKDITPYSIFYKNMFLNSIKEMNKTNNDSFLMLDSEIKPLERNSSLIFTHIPYDLLSYTNFNNLELLESNTGILRNRRTWNKRYYPVSDKDMSMLPFLRCLLLVFGDRTLIRQNEIKLRYLVLDIATKRNWTPLTTLAKIHMDYDLDIKEPFVLQYLKSL